MPDTRSDAQKAAGKEADEAAMASGLNVARSGDGKTVITWPRTDNEGN